MARVAAARFAAQTDPRYLQPTPLLDDRHPSLQALIATRGWRERPERERIGAIYDFVRDEIVFGYNVTDDMPASRVLADGYGQCNTKATLLMSLFRATGIPLPTARCDGRQTASAREPAKSSGDDQR